MSKYLRRRRTNLGWLQTVRLGRSHISGSSAMTVWSTAGRSSSSTAQSLQFPPRLFSGKLKTTINLLLQFTGREANHISTWEFFTASRRFCPRSYFFYRATQLCQRGLGSRNSVCPPVRPSVCHTRALWLIQKTYRRYFTPHERAILLVFW